MTFPFSKMSAFARTILMFCFTVYNNKKRMQRSHTVAGYLLLHLDQQNFLMSVALPAWDISKGVSTYIRERPSNTDLTHIFHYIRVVSPPNLYIQVSVVLKAALVHT